MEEMKREVWKPSPMYWAGLVSNRRSTMGYCTFLWGNLVTWKSEKNSVVTRSSVEEEFQSIPQGTCELLWLKLILDELKIPFNGPMKLFCDNKATISIVHNPVHYNITKHVEVNHHFIKEKIKQKIISMTFVPTTKQVANVFT